jgi:hypothetical protein
VGENSANDRQRPFRYRSADAVRGVGLSLGDRRPVAAVLLDAEPQHAGTGLWGSGYLLGAVAAALLGSGGPANAWVICISNALLCGAYGMMWGGSRSFEGRRVRAPLIVAGAAIWIAAFQFESFYESPASRVSLVSTILAAYALLSARELWHARDRELISRWPTLALLVTHAGFLLARIPFASVVASSAVAGQPHSAVVLVMAAEALFVNFCLPFLRVVMS